MQNKTFTPFPILTTERLILRQLTTDDEQAIFTLRSDTEINRFLGRKIAENLNEAGQFINSVNENIEKNDSIYWGISFRDTNELIGTICFFAFSDEDHTCEIGYELLPKFHGQGIMNEAMEKVLDYVFSTTGVWQIKAFVHKDNHRSILLMEKSSFRNSGAFDKLNPNLLSYYLNTPKSNITL